jgi:MFS transporter, PAT family, beta-lactamase induction signal transducer AmpG
LAEEETRAADPASVGAWARALTVVRSWRLLSVALLSFSSGLPLGLVWIAIPTWMAQAHIDIKVIGLFTLVQAPWTFKLLWSPSMDRYPPPFLGRKRGWILVSQIALVVFGLWLAGVSDHPEAIWVIGGLSVAIAFASATQDIAYDGYTVEVLRPEEHGAAVGARVAVYRAAMTFSGGIAITLAAYVSWKLVNLLLALAYIPFMLVTVKAPDPEGLPEPPKTLREAVWGPFVGFLAQHRSLEILAFVVLYKLSDNLTQALTGPFLVQTGFGAVDVGIARTTIGQAAAVAGTFAGGLLTQTMGLGRALWVFGFLQLVSNLGYAAVAQVGVNRPLMYAAQAFELGSTGLGTGAFGVLLLRLTQKRFSATQYALLSSLFSISRVLAGPVAGLLAATIGWRDFFVLTVFTGIPGMVMLARFVPWGVREPVFSVEAPSWGAPVTPAALVRRGLVGALAAGGAGLVLLAAAGAFSAVVAGKPFDLAGATLAILSPRDFAGWLSAVGIVVVMLTVGLGTAATVAARRGVVTSRS